MSDRRFQSERRRDKRLKARDRRELSDRRRSRRYQAKEGTFAVFVTRKDKLGQIKDISMRGLSFRYVNDDRIAAAAGELKIIIAGYGLFLDKVSAETISDFEVINGFSVSPLKMRQTGIKFVDLSPEQKFQLGRFIRNHTLGES
ncbi:MAG: hypothetical protein AMJ54_09890 [Deltaproteobacteria bacterium SG8_13]|nr:MAG: hypothetical protein AMJ54_09890 [Deltaproteobacteria bacterium SG8_13]